MTPPRTPRPGQLDIPLVWDQRAERPATGGEEPAGAPPAQVADAGAWRLWLAVLADGGAVVLAVAGMWAVATARAGVLAPGQLIAAAAAGLELATVVAFGCLWGWRASPGMLLAGICFTRPIPFGRLGWLWSCWLSSLVLLGVPLVVRRRGEMVAERLAGGRVSFRSLPGDA